jgi:hypothetical protein
MGTNCAPLLADLFLYSYEADFIQGLLKKNEKKLARSFNFTFHYKYVVNQKLEHVDDISLRELFGRIRVSFYKIKDLSLPRTRYLYLRSGPFFFMKHSWTNWVGNPYSTSDTRRVNLVTNPVINHES